MRKVSKIVPNIKFFKLHLNILEFKAFVPPEYSFLLQPRLLAMVLIPKAQVTKRVFQTKNVN